jgi:quercetin dioxygenase-like cupin family protein
MKTFNTLVPVLAGLAMAAIAMPGISAAGECPADQVMAGAITAGETMPKDVTDTVLASIDLTFKGDAWAGNQLRLRRLVAQAGGVVPWHAHDVRPANIMVIEGAITEYRSDCKVPVEHKAGDVTAEANGVAHWWKNNTDKPAVLISADILPPAMEDDHTM